jgi:hypothetical protein
MTDPSWGKTVNAFTSHALSFSIEGLMIVSSSFARLLVAHSNGLAAICELTEYLTDVAYGITVIA